MAQVVADYYAAMNGHSVERALSLLHRDVAVTFPERERDWRGVAAAARDKFGGMFQRMPGFKGTFEVSEEDRAVEEPWGWLLRSLERKIQDCFIHMLRSRLGELYQNSQSERLLIVICR